MLLETKFKLGILIVDQKPERGLGNEPYTLGVEGKGVNVNWYEIICLTFKLIFGTTCNAFMLFMKVSELFVKILHYHIL